MPGKVVLTSCFCQFGAFLGHIKTSHSRLATRSSYLATCTGYLTTSSSHLATRSSRLERRDCHLERRDCRFARKECHLERKDCRFARRECRFATSLCHLERNEGLFWVKIGSPTKKIDSSCRQMRCWGFKMKSENEKTDKLNLKIESKDKIMNAWCGMINLLLETLDLNTFKIPMRPCKTG